MSKFIIIDDNSQMWRDDEYDSIEEATKEIEEYPGCIVYEVVRKFESVIPEKAVLKEVPLSTSPVRN